MRGNWNEMKQALVLPRLEMEKKLAYIGRQHAQETLRRRLEEARIWDELYANHVMLKSSVTSRCTWADILEGVQVLPPREFPDDVRENHTLAEANRRFMEFKTKKSRELLGQRAPTKPSYKDLYKRERGRKETNQRSYDELIRKHKQDKDDLVKNQGSFTPLLPIISEEALRLPDVVDNSDVMLTSQSLQPMTHKQFDTSSSDPTPDSYRSQTELQSPKSTRKRKLVSKHNGLSLAKVVPINIEVPDVDTKILSRRGSKRGIDEDFSAFSRLPPISSSAESRCSEASKKSSTSGTGTI